MTQVQQVDGRSREPDVPVQSLAGQSGAGQSLAGQSGAGQSVAAVQSVDRALSILEILARRRAAGVTEIAVELGVHKSTASRLVSVLEARGFVEQLADRGKYQLGFGLVRLAGSRATPTDLSADGHRLCEALATDVGETVNLAILAGDRAVNISQVRGPASISVQNWVGQSTPLHATSSGKVLLAHATDVDLEQLLGRELARFTDRTTTDLDTLAAELESVRRQGFATTVEEYEVALNAVAAPVRDHTGEVVAAVSVSGPSYRLTPEAFEGVAQHLVVAARDFSRRLGHVG